MANKRLKGSTPPKVPIRAQKVDVTKVVPRALGRLANGEKRVNFAVGGQGDWPLDTLCKIEVERQIGVWESTSAGPAEGLMGHVIDLDFFTKETLIRVKSYNDPHGVIVFINEEIVYEWWQHPDDLPTKEAYREYLNKMDGAWASFVDLKPGDECVAGEFGTEIIRAEDETDWKHCHRCGCDLPDNEAPWEPVCDPCHAIIVAEKEADDDPILEDDDETLTQREGETNLQFIVRAGILTDGDEIVEDDDGDIEWE